MISPELVVFAIKAGVKLAEEARYQFVQRTKDRELVLPLPDIEHEPTVIAAILFFEEPTSEKYLTEFEGLKPLHDKATGMGLEAEEKARYLNLYKEAFTVSATAASNTPVELGSLSLPSDAYDALVRFKQWGMSDPNRPKLERRLIGLVVEIGIDYVASIPGTINTSGRYGQVISGFVQAINDIDFQALAETDRPLEQLFGRLVIAALETVGEHPDLVTSDKNLKELIGIAAKGLSLDVSEKVKEASTTSAKANLEDWAELVFRSLISSAGRKVLSEPAKFLGVEEEPQGKLITNVGNAVVDLLIKNNELDIKRVFGREGLNTLIDAALETVAEHPELITDDKDKGINGLVASIAKELAKHEDLLTPDVLPEVSRMLLEQTGKHLDEIFPGLDPDQHLLLTATGKTLELLGRPVPTGSNLKWKLSFSKDDALVVLETVIDEMAANPAWLVEAAEDIDKNLAAALDAALGVIRKRGNKRLSSEIAAQVLTASVKAVALRQEFLNEVADAKPLVASVIDVVFSQLFKASLPTEAQWQLLRDDAITAAVGISLDRMASSTMDADALAQLKKEAKKQFKLVADGGRVDWEAFDNSLANALPQPV
ncbi:MAG: hypothetical protein AAGB26_03255 [Planctomycetota bacterium]